MQIPISARARSLRPPLGPPVNPNPLRLLVNSRRADGIGQVERSRVGASRARARVHSGVFVCTLSADFEWNGMEFFFLPAVPSLSSLMETFDI